MSLTTPQPNRRQLERFQELAAEAIRRESEALRLYRPLKNTVSFHVSEAFERLVRGGNRSSKTTSCAAEFAHAATGIQMCDCDGNEIADKYPRNKPLTLWVVGYDQKHIGHVIYRKLFMPGAFDIIKDEETGRWRAYQPWSEADKKRKSECKPAPPLIPPRFVKSFGWEDKANGVFSVCHLTNGNRIDAWSSRGKAGQGQPADVLWIDEDIEHAKHVTEWRMRMDGDTSKLFWSAWPHSKNEALRDMHKRAESVKHEEHPSIVEWVLKYSDNPFISDEQKARVLSGLSKNERRARDLGDFLTDTVLVFPRFDRDVQTTTGSGCPEALRAELKKNDWKPDWNWTNFLVLDPGHTQPAVLFVTIPPPDKFGDFLVVYDEIYTPLVDAYQTALEIKTKADDTKFELFMIDGHAGRQTPLGHSKTIQQHYADAFRHHKLKSRVTGSEFIHGSDNIGARNALVRQTMEPREDKTTKLVLVNHMTQALQAEFELYSKTVTKDEVTDKVKAKHDHLCDCLGYLVSYEPAYRMPTKADRPKNKVLEFLKQFKKKPSRPSDGVFYMGAGDRP